MSRDSIFAAARVLVAAGPVAGVLGAWRRRLAGLALLAAAAAAPAAQAETQFFSLSDFQFEDGTVMPELRIAYETQGRLSPERDNAVVLLHDALSDRHAFDALIGPGRLFDTDRYFVVTPDAVGGGESSSPGDGSGQDFPRYTIGDAMAADYALIARGLGLARVRAIVGRTMGAFIGLEWAVRHPEMPQRLVLLAPTARSDANFRLLIDLMTSAIALDPDWAGGRYERNPVEGLRHAGRIYYPWSVTRPYLERIVEDALAEESEASAKAFASWDANALVLRYAACREYDAIGGRGTEPPAALAPAAMPVLLIASAGDRLIDPHDARRLAAALPQARYVEIPGDLGHRAIAAPPGTPAGEAIGGAIAEFLK